MNAIVTFFSNLKLTLTQWALITMAAIIGGLVIALRIQGGRLHQAHVELVGKTLDIKEKAAEEATEKARQKYSDALHDFLSAGGKMLLFLGLLLPLTPAWGDPLLLKCETALGACNNLTTAQGSEIKVLQDSERIWKKEYTNLKSGYVSVLLTSTASGILAGAVTGAALDSQSGLAKGAMLGGLSGLGVALLIELVR